MKRLIDRMRYRFVWWRWFLSGPNTILMTIEGVDLATQDIIYGRWLRREPDFHGTFPYRKVSE